MGNKRGTTSGWKSHKRRKRNLTSYRRHDGLNQPPLQPDGMPSGRCLGPGSKVCRCGKHNLEWKERDRAERAEREQERLLAAIEVPDYDEDGFQPLPVLDLEEALA